MTTIRKFEDLHAWQTARILVNLVYEATKTETFRKDFALVDQIRRASVSVMSNIAEGFGAGSDAEFVRFLGIARRSAYEVQSQAYNGLDQQYISANTFDIIHSTAAESIRQINGLISYLNKSRSVKEPAAEYVLDQSD